VIYGGGHRASAKSYAYPLALGSGNTINGVARSANLAMGGTYTGTNPRTLATWANGDAVYCSDCHDYRGVDVNGPQGASVPFYTIGVKTTSFPNGLTHWYNATNSGTTVSAVPCNKCHATVAGTVHGGNHSSRTCLDCHVKIPHGWNRPRLLIRTQGGTIDGKIQDTAGPYVGSTTVGLQAYRLAAGSTNFLSQSSCIVGSGCSSHSTSGGTPYWP
jgi:hypothetical protein